MYQPNEHQVRYMFEIVQRETRAVFYAADFDVTADTEVLPFLMQYEDSIDTLDWIFQLERATGVSLSDWMQANPVGGWTREWCKRNAHRYTNPEQQLEAFQRENGRATFGGLALYLAAARSPEDLLTCNWFGKPCAKAGAFLLIQRMASRLHKRLVHIKPSDRIGVNMTRGGFKKLWKELRWRTRNALPPLGRTQRDELLLPLQARTYRDLAEVVLQIHPN